MSSSNEHYIGNMCDIELWINKHYSIEGEVYRLVDVTGNMDIMSTDRYYTFQRPILNNGRNRVIYSEERLYDFICDNEFKECKDMDKLSANPLYLNLQFKEYDRKYNDLIDSTYYGLHYNGIWFDEVSQQLPDRVFFNDKKKATTLLVDDVPTVVKTTKGDKYDRKLGFLLAYFQAYSGLTKTQSNKYINNIVKDDKDE